MPFSMPETMPVSLNEVFRSDKSKHNTTSGESAKDSPLKRAVKENEQSVIQSILALQQLPSSQATNNANKNSSSGDAKTSETGDEGLSSLLDYLFEDGQLTRIEYDKVDKCYGINSAMEQAQVLLRLLLNSKDDGALGILLEWLRKVDTKSETLRKLSSNLLPEKQENETKVIFDNENETEFIILEEYCNSTKQHDFYYGRRIQDDAIIGERLYDLHDCMSESNKTLSFNDKKRRARQQKRTGTDNKTKASSDPIDLRDFYLTNGCLETLRNLILYECDEALSVPGWGKVLRNMNGLLSLDVLSIKDLLCQIKSMDHQRATEEETRIAKMVRKIYSERRELQQQPNNLLEIQKPTGNTIHKPGGGREEVDNQNENVFKQGSNQERTNDLDQSTIRFSKYGSSAKWKQIIYRTLQLWKLRNGSYSTFYSLIGVFQHSNLYQTADFLLERKKEVQSRENENDVDEGNVNDVNTGTKPTFSPYQ